MYRRQSEDSQQRPLSNVDYHSTSGQETPIHDKEMSYGQNYRTPPVTQLKSSGARSSGRFAGRRKWLVIGGIVLILAIVGGVVGGVVGSNSKGSNKKNSSSNSGSGSGGGSGTGGTGNNPGSSSNPAFGLGSGSQDNFVPKVSASFGRSCAK
jgi:hypothetical protein